MGTGRRPSAPAADSGVGVPEEIPRNSARNPAHESQTIGAPMHLPGLPASGCAAGRSQADQHMSTDYPCYITPRRAALIRLDLEAACGGRSRPNPNRAAAEAAPDLFDAQGVALG